MLSIIFIVTFQHRTRIALLLCMPIEDLIKETCMVFTSTRALLLGIICSSSIFFCSPLMANEIIQPDRPGIATGTYTVNPGQYILEMGVQSNFRRDGNKPNALAVPQLTLRGGITDKLEWDIISNGAVLSDADGEQAQWSFSDVSVGGKYSIVESDNWNLSALALVSLPVGTKGTTSDNVDPLIGLLWDANINDSISAFGNVNMSSFEADEGRIHDVQFALGLNFSHSEKLGSFVELFASKPYGDDPSTAVFDAGLTYLLENRVQLDFSAGVALNNDSDHFVGAGVAWLF